GEGEDRELRLSRREIRLADAPLRLEGARQVGVAVERDAVRRERDDLLERGGEARDRLPGQAVDEVEVDGAEAARARLFDRGARDLLALDAVHRFLDRRVEVLHADRAAVEAEAGEELERPGGNAPRVDLDRALEVG